MAIRPAGVELFHAGGRTDMTKILVALGNFFERILIKMTTI